MLIRLKEKIPRGPRGIPRYTFGAGEFGHDQATTAEAADHPAKDRIGHTRHGCEDRCRNDVLVADRELRGEHLPLQYTLVQPTSYSFSAGRTCSVNGGAVGK